MFRPLSLIVCLVASMCTRASAQGPTDPRSPTESQAAFHLADNNLTIELVASEPQVVSPVAIAWDDQGRMFVAEMLDYPLGPANGRIRMLDDRDEQGGYQRSTVFADGLRFPSSVLPYQGGVLVSAAPNIHLLRDRDGNRVADTNRIVLTGFAEGNQQLRVNGLMRGLDNWIYGANGRSNGNIHLVDESEERALSLERHDFRFDPRTRDYEVATGPSQFGVAEDDWGHRFLSWNTLPMRHAVLEPRHLDRLAHLPTQEGIALIADPADSGRLYPKSPSPVTFNREPVLFFNASAGITIFRGNTLGAEYNGNFFVCEPLLNLVHRRELAPSGATFIARRADTDREFLASSDPWFHPVFVTTGPDEALYIVDFYRQWVEHPHYTPQEVRDQVDWRHGAEHGRIWRIRRKDATLRWPPALTDVPNDVLIDQSFRHGAWERMTAQRLLVERDAQVAVPQLRQAVREMDGARPSLIQRGVHALWTLEGLRALDDDTLIYALQFRDPRVSEQAARLAEGRVRESPEILDAVCNCVLVNDPKVHLRVALALADVDNPQAIEALATIAVSSADDPWIRIAVLSSAGHNVWPLLKTLLSTKHAEAVSRNESTLLLLEQGASLVGARDNNDERLACMLLGGDDSLALEARLALLAGITDGMSRRGLSLTSLRDSSTEAASVVSQHILPLLAIAAKQSMSTESSEIVRVRAITTLARCQPEIAAALLPRLLRAEQPPTLQATAARLLGEMLDRQVAASALEQWNELSVDTRRLLLGAMLRAPSLAEVVLDGIDNDQLSTTDLDAASIEQLRRLPGDALEQRVKRLFADDPSSDRQGVVDRYQAALELKGDAHRGAAIFRAHCQACHRLQQQGHRVGPDLTAVAARPPAALLEDLLNPSKEVAPDYMNFVLVTHSGTVISGLVAGETADAVTLRRSEGIEEVISRSDMQQLRGTGKSLMPEGFEQQLAPQDIADVIRFLHNPSE